MIISRRENLEYIKDQPDFNDFDDPDELLAHIGPAWIDDPGMRPRHGWSSAVQIISCGVSMGNMVGFQYGGIVPMIGSPDDRWGLNSWDSFDRLRALHTERDGQPWTTLILSYREDTGEFGHQLIYGNDHPELNVTTFRLLPNEIIRALRPTRGTPLEVPVTARGAWTAVAAYKRAHGVKSPPLKNGEYSVDRLDGGWRIYATNTPDQTETLADITGARDHAVALVNDSAEITITTANVDTHQAELDALPTHDTTWD